MRVCWTFSSDEELRVKLLALGVTNISANLFLFCFVLLSLLFFFSLAMENRDELVQQVNLFLCVTNKSS